MAVNALIFDSGVGGFSVLQHIRQTVPGLSSYYLMDNQLFPYGIQPDEVLIERIVKLCLQVCNEEKIDLIVIACNTASTLALPALREVLDIPVIGVVPAIKTAASQSQTKDIALLATPATIDRPYIDQLILDHGKDCQVERIGSSELVKLAENFWFQEDQSFQAELDLSRLETILAPLKENRKIDQLILGCTHFPLLSQQIALLFPKVTLVDSGHAIARRICFILQQLGHDLSELQQDDQAHKLLITADIDNKVAFLSACQRIAPYQSFNII
jgi:glutamate racemase